MQKWERYPWEFFASRLRRVCLFVCLFVCDCFCFGYFSGVTKVENLGFEHDKNFFFEPRWVPSFL